MKKAYYIVGAVLFGLGAYFLYSKVRNGNVSFNYRNEDVAQAEDGNHLEPPMEVPILATPPLIS